MQILAVVLNLFFSWRRKQVCKTALSKSHENRLEEGQFETWKLIDFLEYCSCHPWSTVHRACSKVDLKIECLKPSWQKREMVMLPYQCLIFLPLSSVFQRLANDKFCAKNRCILLTVRYYWLDLYLCWKYEDNKYCSMLSTNTKVFFTGEGLPRCSH